MYKGDDRMNKEKEQRAINILKTFEPPDEPYWLCYSGGKDSDVISILAKLADVKHIRHHNLTTVDSPITMQYIKSQPDIIIEKSRWADGTHKTMSNLIIRKKMLPTRLIRYCCSELKEQGGKGHLTITGVRAAESVSRAKKAGLVKITGKPKTVRKIADEVGADYNKDNDKMLVMNFDNSQTRRVTELCYRTTSTIINPILDWTDEDVWEFLKHYGCESNPEYQCGMKRIGCVGCPMAGLKNRLNKFTIYPKYFRMYYTAVKKIFEENGKNFKVAQTPLELMAWWLGYKDFNVFIKDYAEILEINKIEVVDNEFY